MTQEPNLQKRPPTADVGQQLRDRMELCDRKIVALTQALESLQDPAALAMWQCFWEVPEGVVALLERRRADLILAKSAAETIIAVMERSADTRELLEALAMLERYDRGKPIFGVTNFGPGSVGAPAV